MWRAEDKYALSSAELDILERRVRALLKPDEYMGKKGCYTVSSLYFDDPSNSILTDTVNGNPVRCKYRLRIYNDALKSARLEIKEKRNQWVEKFITPLSEDETASVRNGYAPASTDEVRRRFQTALDTRLLHPAAIVTYERSAYAFDAGNVRITFDRHIRASRDFERFGKKKMIYCNAETDGILEVKYDTFLPIFIAKLLETGSMQMTSHSKYGLCRQALDR